METIIICNEVEKLENEKDLKELKNVKETFLKGDKEITSSLIEKIHCERCLEKDKIYPLEKWEDHPFQNEALSEDLGFYLPKNNSYALSQTFGDNWREREIKGWKKFICSEFWSDDEMTSFFYFLAIWYGTLFLWFFCSKRGIFPFLCRLKGYYFPQSG